MQIIAGLAWLAVAVCMTPGVVRVLNGDGSTFDRRALPLPFVGIVQAGFSLRWFIWPRAMDTMACAELTYWALLYLLSTACAILILDTYRLAR